jgi:cytidyltransferase-like protein
MDREVVVAVSGYFDPLHAGHVAMFSAAAELGTRLLVIVNNEAQQIAKKGRVIQSCADRMLIVRHLRMVDEVHESIDRDATVRQTLRQLRGRHPDARFIFANGGDRSDVDACSERPVCDELGIECMGGIGGADKRDASSRINALLGI